MNVFDRPDFKEAEEKEQEKQRQYLEEKGYQLVNVSKVFPWINQIESIKDLRPEYELIEMRTGKRISGMIDCSYWQAINWAIKYVRNF